MLLHLLPTILLLHLLERMMAQPAKTQLEANILIILLLPFFDEGEALMLEMMCMLFWFCDSELMRYERRSLPEMQMIHQELKMQILSASLTSFF